MFHFNAFHAVKCVCCIDSYTKGESLCYSSFRICAFLVIEFEKLGACSEIQQAVGLSNLNDD